MFALDLSQLSFSFFFCVPAAEPVTKKKEVVNRQTVKLWKKEAPEDPSDEENEGP